MVSLSLVAAGGLSNAIDRLLDGKVTDMISVWKWPVFNVADMAITVGVALLFFVSRQEKSAAAAAPSSELPPG
jgi:signal peptidase II